MNPNKTLWEKGDFTRIASTMRTSGEEFSSAVGARKGMKILDLGCGDGNTAIPFARLGAEVIGVDIAKNLVDAGNERARQEGLNNVRFVEGDAADLGIFRDGEFDLTVSIFGAMFASNPFNVAKEMVRVTKKGGKIIMGNWIPNDPTLVAQILRISSAYTPPPPEGFVSPMTWGVEKNVIERFAAAGIPEQDISFERTPWTFYAPYSTADYVQEFKHYYGPTMNAFDAAAKNGKSAELQQELEELFNKHNKANSADKLEITAAFLKVTVQC